MDLKLSAGFDSGCEEWLRRYPWFDLPLLKAYGEGKDLPRRLAILALWRPAILKPCGFTVATGEVQATEQEPVSYPGEDTLAIIDEFIAAGEHRIAVNEETPDQLPSAPQEDCMPDELLTEELAAVYLLQGMTRQAVEIYRRLSLLNPEKSVYFADIIERALSAEATDSDDIKQ